jgi:hypothetical protein
MTRSENIGHPWQGDRTYLHDDLMYQGPAGEIQGADAYLEHINAVGPNYRSQTSVNQTSGDIRTAALRDRKLKETISAPSECERKLSQYWR